MPYLCIGTEYVFLPLFLEEFNSSWEKLNRRISFLAVPPFLSARPRDKMHDPADANFWVCLPFPVRRGNGGLRRKTYVAVRDFPADSRLTSSCTIVCMKSWRKPIHTYIVHVQSVTMYVCMHVRICMHTIHHWQTRTASVRSFKFSYLSRSRNMPPISTQRMQALRCARPNEGCTVEVYFWRYACLWLVLGVPFQLPFHWFQGLAWYESRWF